MRKHVHFFGILGVVCLIFAIATYLLVAFDHFYFVPIHLTLGLICIAIFLFGGGLRNVGKSTLKRRAGFGAGVTVYSTLFVGILVATNYAASKHDFFHYDSTEQKIFTLAPQTFKVVTNLKTAIHIRAFYLGGEIEPKTESLLNRISKQSDKVTWELIDPEKKPGVVEKFTITEPSTLHFSFDEGDSTRYSKVVAEKTEQEIVNAILKLTRGAAKKIYYLVGHGEPELDGQKEQGYFLVREAIESENIIIETLSLAELESVPEDAAAIILAAPRRELLTSEMQLLENYLVQGGNALLLNEPNTTGSVSALAKNAAITVGNDVVVAQVLRLLAAPGLGVEPLVNSFKPHPVTEDFSESLVFFTISSVASSLEGRGAKTVTELALTGKASWAEKNLTALFSEKPKANLDPDDEKGPISIAAAFEGKYSTNTEQTSEIKKSRVLVIGDSDFVSNVNIRKVFNRDFFLNSLNWVIGEEKSVSIRAGTLRESTVGITAQQFSIFFLLAAILLPEVVLIGGLAVWWSRRN